MKLTTTTHTHTKIAEKNINETKSQLSENKIDFYQIWSFSSDRDVNLYADLQRMKERHNYQ